MFQYIFQRDFLYSLFRCFLNVQVKIPQHQLDIYTHATGRIGVDVLMEQRLVALYYRDYCQTHSLSFDNRVYLVMAFHDRDDVLGEAALTE